MNNNEREIVVVPEKKEKIKRIKEKYKNLTMDDSTAEKIRRLEIANGILKASSTIMGIATAINLIIPDAIPFLDEALMGGITSVIGGASVIVQNKIDDLAKNGSTEVKTEEIKDLSVQIGSVLAEVKRKKEERKNVADINQNGPYHHKK